MDSPKVGLIFTEEYQKYNFGPRHPLRPLRLMLTYSLMDQLGLLTHERVEILKPNQCSKEDLLRVHSTDYVNVVEKLSKDPNDESVKPFVYGLGPGDNPVFEGMYDASALVCGASMLAVDEVWNDDQFNVSFNPSGGLHHAMRNRASGFCIFNDIAVAIKHLQHQNPEARIAYLDIDCHHGDGVQWLFYKDPNVLTISFHESGKFLFPGTGETKEVGESGAEGTSINFPLLPGTSNKMYLKLFKNCVPQILESFQPDILITQLGVDTHYNDPLTQMGLSIQAHLDLAQLMEDYVKKYCGNKWVALGGGGYLMSVVPRAWSIYLAQMLDVKLENALPKKWIEEVKEKVPFEETPYELWDRNDKIEVQLLSHPEIAKKMIDYTNSLIEVCEEQYIPRLKKA